ncbi:MAG: TIGR03617 family F420-dependent LLM class oxidoreductase [Pseudomonadales bacterium]
MKIDASMSADLDFAASGARRFEALGYDGLKVAELQHDPFLALTLAADATDRIELMTSVAVAFARNPMSTAQLAHDLNAFSQGRFILGLGTQVKAHVTRRFGMPWHHGPDQMQEFLEALHHIFDHFYDNEPLEFEGDYYRHTLMPKTFKPTNTQAGRHRILLSATGPKMTIVAAESADGLIMHPFSTEDYIRAVNLPAITSGLARAELDRAEFEIDLAPLIVTGETDESMDAATAAARGRIAFYGSTPGYRMVLAHHGWEDLQTELNRLMKMRRTDEMPALITDEILEKFAVVGPPSEIGPELVKRYGDIVDRMSIQPEGLSDAALSELISSVKTGVKQLKGDSGLEG